MEEGGVMERKQGKGGGGAIERKQERAMERKQEGGKKGGVSNRTGSK